MDENLVYRNRHVNNAKPSNKTSAFVLYQYNACSSLNYRNVSDILAVQQSSVAPYFIPLNHGQESMNGACGLMKVSPCNKIQAESKHCIIFTADFHVAAF